MSEQNRFEINWTRSAGSALGAVSSAVLLSTLGVAGTLIGAAVGSLVITVGGAVYTTSLRATKERVLKTADRTGQTSTRARGNRDPVDAPVQDSTWGPLPESLDEPLPEEDDSSSGTQWGQVLRDLPWKRIAGGAVALFAIAMALILAFELTTGRAVSSYTGGSSKTETGTSIPGFKGRSGSGVDPEQNQQDPQQQDPQQQDEAPQDEAPQDPPEQEEAPQDPPEQEEAPQDPQPQEKAPQGE